MKIGVLGTGAVGKTIATKLISLGHDVMLGSRTAKNASAARWVKDCGAHATQGTFADAASHGELLFNCAKGSVALDVLAMTQDCFPDAGLEVGDVLATWAGIRPSLKRFTSWPNSFKTPCFGSGRPVKGSRCFFQKLAKRSFSGT